jgi:hypothetical protein
VVTTTSLDYPTTQLHGRGELSRPDRTHPWHGGQLARLHGAECRQRAHRGKQVVCYGKHIVAPVAPAHDQSEQLGVMEPIRSS